MLKKIKTIIILTFFCGLCSGYAQSEMTKKLLGQWVWVEETEEKNSLNNTEIVSINNPRSTSDIESLPEIIMTFNPDNTLIIDETGAKSNSTFKISDSILSLGNREYIILTLDNDRLVFKDKDDVLDNNYTYKRLEN
ncbi:hypothetical protein [Aquimarina sp. AU474]|uniref:hypothetical protein n=1 Tax=Aquimarina sp. AU474 TaxID=2108529 RepID=UPI00135BE831|nr:hypothetical protein [Aquimarina sp. AU474]